jgi:endonuclease/exonuclease/phosphatase family metal-dependent hydrolase
MNKSPYPVIICGDFNDTPVSYAYHQLTSNYQDAFECCGNGIGKTLKGKIPAFRIDYVIYDNNFTPLSYQELKVNLSDHYPVKSEFVIKPD